MRYLRLATSFVTCLAALAVLVAVVYAAARFESDAGGAQRARVDQDAGITIIQTVTLLSPGPTTPESLTSIHEFEWSGFGNSFGVRLPADFYSITVGSIGYELITVTNPEPDGFGEVFTRQILLTPTAALTTYLSYYTDSRAVRYGNHYSLPLHSSLNNPFVFTGIVVFSDPITFTGYHIGPKDNQSFSPAVQAGNQVWWGPISLSPQPDPDPQKPARARFDRNVTFGHPLFPVDLLIRSAGLLMRPDSTSVQVTATIVNIGSANTDSSFMVELYDRPSLTPPTGPLDHAGGACRDAPACVNYRPANYVRVTSTLEPSHSVPITFDYSFEIPGRRELFLQVDPSIAVEGAYGGIVGYILEPSGGETNNIYSIGGVQARAKLYLPILMKNP